MKKNQLLLKKIIVQIRIIFIYYSIFMGMRKKKKLTELINLYYLNRSKLNTFIESIPKSKKNRRCNIHSLDKIKIIKVKKIQNYYFFYFYL